MFTCPKGCQSTDADYCSQCGAKMTPPRAPVSSPLIRAGSPPTSLEKCPDCGAARVPVNAVFCELCRYDFLTGASSRIIPAPVIIAASVVAINVPNEPAESAPAAQPNPPAAPEAPVPANPAPAPHAAVLVRWEVHVSVDRAAFKPQPPIVSPDDIPERTFPLDLSDMLIGRRSDTKDIHPEIPLNDDAAVSHRHAKLLRQPDGSYCLLDLGSSNGTKLNGTDMVPGVRVKVKPGDIVRAGRFSVLAIREQNTL